MSPRERARPRQGAPVIFSATSVTPANVEIDDLAEHIGGTWVLVVEIAEDRHRRRCFLSVAAAERAAERARAGGRNCGVYLAELTPLLRLPADPLSETAVAPWCG